MSAQAGGSVVLGYRPQGAQQNGAVLVLSATRPAPASSKVVATTGARWVAGSKSHSATRAPMQTTRTNGIGACAPWVRGSHSSAEGVSRWGVTTRRDDPRAAVWGRFSVLASTQALVPWLVTVLRDAERSSPWGKYSLHAGVSPVAPWVVSAKQDQSGTVPWGQHLFAQIEAVTCWVGGHPAGADRYLPWTKFSRQMAPGWGVVTPPGDPEGTEALVVIPIQRVYIVVNSVTLMRVDGSVVIQTLNMSMSLDVDSWTWSASATIPGRALEDVSPNTNGDPVELEAVVNSVAYRFLVESVTRDRSFNQSAIKIGMRGKTALLDTPYSPVQTFGNTGARTMAQLAGDVLTLNGTPLGWTVNWLPDDWLVPAGVFAHQGSYISAINTLAAAAGAYVLPHRTSQEFSIVPRYPTAPWGWSGLTPDFELPSAVTVQESIEWVNQPVYNRVFVSGTGHGVLGQVTRTGTAGDLPAPMITDPLITDVIAARQRGLPVLAATGRMAKVSLRLPVLSATGIIQPGKLVRYTDGADVRLGLTRSVSVSVGQNATDLRQTISLETHL